jgi:hypothetical protein
MGLSRSTYSIDKIISSEVLKNGDNLKDLATDGVKIIRRRKS